MAKESTRKKREAPAIKGSKLKVAKVPTAADVGYETAAKKQAASAYEKGVEAEVDRVVEEKAKKPDLPGIGDNTESKDGTANVAGVTGAQLKSYIERVERLEEEKKALAEDIKEIYGEAKGMGFDAKAMRTLVRLRGMDGEKRREEEEILEVYKSAIGLC